jgi:hypothetical protein
MNNNLLGVDAEKFATGPDGLAVPVLEFFNNTAPGAVEVHKDIPSDIQPGGYTSYEVPLRNAKLTEDGLPFEVPITPSRNVETIVRRLGRGVVEAWKIAETNGYQVSASPLVYLEESYLEYRPELRVLGCSPDMCVYDEERLSSPSQDARETNWRTGGFHVHFSLPNLRQDVYLAQSLVLACDATLGIVDVLLEHSDLGRKRREMYGAAGKFRLQPWGVEYRTPSSTVVVHPEVTEAFLSIAKTLHAAFEQNELDGYNLIDSLGFDDVVTAINEVDVDKAMVLWEQVTKPLADTALGINSEAVDLIYILGTNGGVVGYYGNYLMEGWKR